MSSNGKLVDDTVAERGKKHEHSTVERSERYDNSESLDDIARNCNDNRKHSMGRKGGKRGMKPRSRRNRKRPRGGGVLGLGDTDGGLNNQDENVKEEEEHVKIEIVNLSDATRVLSDNVKMDVRAWGGKRVRIVRPYPFAFATFAKARWVGRPVIDVYHEEFGSYPKSYYESAINEGRILVSGKQVSCEYKIKGGDELTHTVHRHEPAVAVSDEASLSSLVDSERTQKKEELKSSALIKVIYEDNDVIVVDKPATLPIHPCGGYNFNSLFHILAEQDPNLKGRLHTVHRLDRLTSGVTIVAKSTHVAKSLGKCISDREHCHKTYIARVKGRFPLGIPTKLSRLSAICRKEDSKDGLGGGGTEDAGSSCDQQKQAPCQFGELVDIPGSLVNESSRGKGNKNNTTPALGFWITDGLGIIHGDATVSDVFESRQNMKKLLGQEKSLTHQPEDLETNMEGRQTNDLTSSTNAEVRSEQRWFHLACPCRVASHKNGICEAGDFSHLSKSEAEDKKFGIKAAQTSFAVIDYDTETDSTIVLAKPVTGRTHQIRLHLEYLGHPIANDPNYGGDIWYGDPAGAAACQDAKEKMDEMDLMAGSQEPGCKIATNTLSSSFVQRPKDATSTDVPATEAEVQNAALQVRDKGETLLSFIKKTCVWCARSRGGDRVLFEFLVRSQGIWLHAFEYKVIGGNGELLKYRSDPPTWICLR
uniref:Pseudouridine synthase RsuA/RluA-like domain-containing protein n=1 Tax=Ditylum brightwellii TaxID=49249 RepID=A0A7S2A4V6_9STRA|mmetsp:Transcript_8367/g.12484  ORF Transcript_8367/g.12484 Transcript_8367/m.12484 type:complete len:704 (+) Transcript_8367:156-2267(+)